MSLKAALETLGFDPCYHMTEVFAHPEHTRFWISAWRGEPADWDGVLGEYWWLRKTIPKSVPRHLVPTDAG